MSGRLIITTKKTYCPWNQQNVERVLRDERLERERIEKEAQLERDAAKARRRGELGGTAAADGEGLKHVNLFPEAEEAELRLARGISGKTTEKKGDNGIMPVPLGGEEAANRKAGSVPFYMQRGKSDNSSSYNQMRVLGRKVEADVITAKIMNDQACSREESRKRKNDPMMRFYISGECNVSGSGGDKLTRDIRTDAVQEVEYALKVSQPHDNPTTRRRHKAKKEHRHRKDSKRRKREGDNSTTVSSDSSTSSTSHRRHSSKTRKRKHKSGHERTSKKRSKRDRDRKHSHSDTTEDPMLLATAQHIHNKTTTQSEEETIENLRKRRQEREARESQREREMCSDWISGVARMEHLEMIEKGDILISGIRCLVESDNK